MSVELPIICAVYKAKSREETYLFVDNAEGLVRVPEELLGRFEDSIPVTKFKLHSERALARAEAPRVLEAIRSQGYYLQLPPPVDTDMADLAIRNHKLPR